jgi:hypothetical protein
MANFLIISKSMFFSDLANCHVKSEPIDDEIMIVKILPPKAEVKKILPPKAKAEVKWPPLKSVSPSSTEMTTSEANAKLAVGNSNMQKKVNDKNNKNDNSNENGHANEHDYAGSSRQEFDQLEWGKESVPEHRPAIFTKIREKGIPLSRTR